MITAPSTTNSKIIRITVVRPAIMSVTLLTAVVADQSMYVDDELVSQVISLLVAKERSLPTEVHLHSLVSMPMTSPDEVGET